VNQAQTPRFHSRDFEMPRRWPVGLISLLLFMATVLSLVSIGAGVQLGLGMAAETARLEAGKPKRMSATTIPPFIDCSKRALQEIRTACYLRAQSELTTQK
jgi:hypothetical protein